ncbi:MAG: hypothetical protein JWQ13_684 [Ramlibacter sp.]|jgi:hypothetical protein|nr:hypothetical protein [Ramlibacter sp.]
MTPSEKLARSRLAIVEYLGRHEHRGERDASDAESPDAAGGEAADGERRSRRGGWFGGLSGAARSWWRHHPAQMALEMASPALQSYMRRKPFQVLAISAGVGALLVVTRPWRLISLTTLVVAIVKSSQLSGVVMSALSDAQGWHAQQQGREPEL